VDADHDRAAGPNVCAQAVAGVGRLGVRVVVSVVLIATFLASALTNTAGVTTQTDSKRADQLRAQRMGSGSAPSDVVVVRSQTLTVDDPAFQDQVQLLRQAAVATGVLDAATVAAARVEDMLLVFGSLVAGLVPLLLAVAVPVLDLDRGFAGVSTLPHRFPSKQGLIALQASFPGATTEPAQVVVDGQVHAPQVQAAIDRLRRELDGRNPFGPATLQDNDAGDLAVLSVPVGADAQSAQAHSAVRQLRDSLIPAAFAGVHAQVLVTGDTAENLDYFAIIGFWLPLVLVFVLGLSFVLLVLAFRTIVVPAVAIVLNLLSVGAAYGLLVLVFQHGYGANLLGLQQVDAVEAWVPLFCSRCCSGCPWTIRCSYSAASTNATARSPTPVARWWSAWARPPGSSPAPPSSSWRCSAASPQVTW
jgi:MMPL family